MNAKLSYILSKKPHTIILKLMQEKKSTELISDVIKQLSIME